MACSTALGTEGGVGDAAWLSVLPRTKDPVVVFPQCAIESRQLPQLHLSKVILIFRRLDALFQDVAYLLHSFLDILHGVGGDQGMQRLIFPWEHLSILPADLPLLHRTFSTDHDLSTALLFNVLQCITTWPNQQTNKVDFGVFILGNHNFVVDPGCWRFIICRRLEFGVESNHLSDERVSFLLNLLPRAILAGV